ncbi:oligosaccharyltransferase complex subunit gamma [Pseudohyphozyma bogoriensis]|nr:oligosaccharyltransferase complex subunit gamma [Pseudohyphozyma bogoriensis]
MHVSVALLAALPLLSTVSAATAATKEKFKAIAKRNNGLIKLNSASYDELVDGPRDYSVTVLLTAMGAQYKCSPCQQFDPEHALVAKQWSKHAESDDHFFGVLDFEDGQAIYQRFGLSSAPTFQLYMPSTGPRASSEKGPSSMDFSRAGFKAESLAQHLQNSANLPLKFQRPVDKVKLFTLGGSLAAIAILGITAWPFFKIFLTRTYIWSFTTIIVILLMTSGYMWNQIRNPPYLNVDRSGRVSYVAGGYSNQLGAETHIVSAIYGCLALSAYTLAHTIPKLRDPIRQRLAVYVWTGISIVMMGVLMNLFGLKQGGYPFRFF